MPVQICFQPCSRIRVDLLSYESKPTDKRVTAIRLKSWKKLDGRRLYSGYRKLAFVPFVAFDTNN